MNEVTQQRIANYHAILDVADTLIARWFDSAATTAAATPDPPDPATLSTMVLTLRRVIDTRHRLDNWDNPPKSPRPRNPNGFNFDREWTDEEEEADAQAIIKMMEMDCLDEDGNEYEDEDGDETTPDNDDAPEFDNSAREAAPNQPPAPTIPSTTSTPPTPPTPIPIPFGPVALFCPTSPKARPHTSLGQLHTVPPCTAPVANSEFLALALNLALAPSRYHSNQDDGSGFPRSHNLNSCISSDSTRRPPTRTASPVFPLELPTPEFNHGDIRGPKASAPARSPPPRSPPPFSARYSASPPPAY